MNRRRREEPQPIAETEQEDWVLASGPRPRASLGVIISLRLDPQLAARMHTAAAEDGTTLSGFVRLAVVHELDRRQVAPRVLPGEFLQRLAEVNRAARALVKSAASLQSQLSPADGQPDSAVVPPPDRRARR